ncbi:MAG: hypothetical protein GX259_05500 [Bacteroidales bacterium]|nr:hypothetical protein [Bacteroidales bacterium]
MKNFYFILAFFMLFSWSNKVFSQIQINEKTDRTPTEKQAVYIKNEPFVEKQQLDNEINVEEINISIKAKKELLENTSDQSLKAILNEEIQSLQNELKTIESRHKIEIIPAKVELK